MARKYDLTTFEGTIDFLSHVPEDMIGKVESAFYKIAKHAVRRVVANAPIWKGAPNYEEAYEHLWGQLRSNVSAFINGNLVVSGSETAGGVVDYGASASHSSGGSQQTEFMIQAVALDDSGFDYAALMHEALESALGGGTRQLGELSASMPGTPEGGVGGKFITRVMDYHLQKYQAILQKAVDMILEDYDPEDIIG